MAFSDHKIQSFAKKLADLPDQPNLSASELKAYFDSSPEELRQAHNALCTDAERLDNRVSGIVAETFGDSIPKTMLSAELQAELDAKAAQTALSAEAEARESADTALQTQVLTKCELHCGEYIGSAAEANVVEGTHTLDAVTTWQNIQLGFRPKMVLLFSQTEMLTTFNNYMQYAVYLCGGETPTFDGLYYAQITDTGFRTCSVYRTRGASVRCNTIGQKYGFVAIK